MNTITEWFNGLKDKFKTAKEERETRNEVNGLLDKIDEKYYAQIFKLINDTVVIGNKSKYNTLEYLENQIMTSDAKDMKEFGINVKVCENERVHTIKGILIKFIEMSKQIRRDQWKTSSNPEKKGDFEARKHTAQESSIDRNLRIVKLLHLNEKTAREYGIALSVEDLKEDEKAVRKTKNLVENAKTDSAFKSFYDNFQAIYKLGEPTSESGEFLNAIYADLTSMGENNSFGLKGDSLTAALRLVEETIKVRRSTFVFGNKAKETKEPEEQADMGMN